MTESQHDRFYFVSDLRGDRHFRDRLDSHGGDLMNIQTITPKRQAELFFTRKLEATAIELEAVILKLSEARILFAAAQRNDDYALTITAGNAVVKYADQLAYLAGGVKIAIENEHQESGHDHYRR